MYDILLILLIAVAVSTLGTLAGFGGAVFLVPILMLFFGYSMQTAIGSVIVALVPSSLLSTIFNFRNGSIDFRVGTLLEIPTVIGTMIGAVLVAIIPVFPLKIIFSIFVFIIGFLMLKGKDQDEPREKNSFMRRLNKTKPSFIFKNKNLFVAYQISLWMLGFFGLTTGILAGLFGVGGGFMKTPIMIKLFKMPHKIATSTALFMIVITSFFGSISHYLLGHVEFNKSIPVIIGFLMGAVTGRLVNRQVTSKVLERIIALALILAGIAVAVNAFVI